MTYGGLSTKRETTYDNSAGVHWNEPIHPALVVQTALTAYTVTPIYLGKSSIRFPMVTDLTYIKTVSRIKNVAGDEPLRVSAEVTECLL